MRLAEGAASVNKPTAAADIANGAPQNPDGDWARFGEWFDRTVYCAKELAKFQSPQIKAVDAPTPPPENKSDGKPPKRFTLTIFEGAQRIGVAEVGSAV